MKYILATLGLVLCIHSTKAQSYISSDIYKTDPKLYLSEVQNPENKDAILIDRTIFSNSILDYNGNTRVGTSYFSEWKNHLNNLAVCNNGKSTIPNISELQKTHDQSLQNNDATPIILTDISFERVSQKALENEELSEINGKLQNLNINKSSFNKHKFITACVKGKYIYGDNLDFIIPKSLYITNNTDEIESIHIDFGEGYSEVFFDQTFSVNLESKTKDVLGKLKIEKSNPITGRKEITYSHFTFVKKGTLTVPLPSQINTSLLKSAPKPGTGLLYYPTSTKDIEYCIYFNSSSNHNKLRRPIIICDGFDPGNSKNYYENISEYDQRGLYEILNGDPSKNEANPQRESANLVAKLKARGFDIVIVNFKSGDGDIRTNAKILRNFLNNIINTTYRDEYTEESILVGPSMSGLITRYALTTMEKANEEHYVKQWISFDSPHKGANVSIGFQKLLYLLNDRTSSDDLKGALNTLNSIAAQQMLLSHYRYIINNNNSKNPLHTSFYEELDKLGYPTISTNYAISCGGNSKRFVAGAKIAEFNIAGNSVTMEAYANHNTDGNHKIFHSKIFGFNKYVNTSNHIGYDNAPGSGYAMNGFFNNKDINGFNPPDLPQYKSFTFMPCPSTFGIEVTRSNVYRGWKYFKDNKLSPFDEIFGMDENQDHVQITKETADNIILASILDDEFSNSTIPMVRPNTAITKTVSNQVSYKAKNSIAFANANNKLIVKPQAKVLASAEKSITFCPGVSIEKGAVLLADINTVIYSTASLKNDNYTAIDYTKELKYAHYISNYSSETEIDNTGLVDFCSIYPNPSQDYVTIKHLESAKSIKLITQDGKIIYQKVNSGDSLSTINISMFPVGIYFVQIDNYAPQKIIKQ